MIPESINIASKPVSTMILVFILGLFCWAFILWYESKKDGFNSERFFNLMFTSLIISAGTSYALFRLFEWLKIFRPSNHFLLIDENSVLVLVFFLISLLPIFYYSKRYRWSSFRILDIYSLGFGIFLMFLSLGYFLIFSNKEYLALFLFLVILYLGIMRNRGYKYMSGVIFSLFVIFISLSFVVYLRKSGYLLFASILFTIGVINLHLRGKKTMSKSILPENFILSLKNKLLSKEKRLEVEQQKLIKDDPYLQHGRASDNAETYDDVLEDTGKIITDARISTISGLKIQVKKALAAIKLGKYGKCEICGKNIDKARLEAYPEATTCIDCATDHSQMEDIRQDEILEKNI